MAFPPFMLSNIRNLDVAEINRKIEQINRALQDIYRGTIYANRGGPVIRPDQLPDAFALSGSINAFSLTSGAVKAHHIASGQISGAHLALNAVGPQHIGSGQISGQHIGWAVAAFTSTVQYTISITVAGQHYKLYCASAANPAP